ncbi:unnamed protein product [Zymoseptoria tritici ST99CH_3D7]|uniref:Uncharacterized protein n=1 Tax=Zymoseptoria tritici (strain ST99CH_3D7) TaxID=1276538 RepID=A0A1X7RPH0_ZYMT9|nr:unnamed protein product [Zymoseptoria tritici ST99CH_3D7]
MALENITLSDIIAMDNTYVSRMQVRQSIMEDHPDATIQSTPVADKAVLELHDWMFRTYLPMRYPQIYYRQSGADGGLLNGVSNKIIPLSPSSAVEALRALGSNIDTDFLVLMPCSISPDGLPIYHLQAFVTCFPSGFSLRKKLGMPLAEIHTPVPGYKAKLEKSMDRFFARLECGKAVKRSNWGITTVTDLFLEGGTHFHNDKASDGPSSTSTEGDGPSTRVLDGIEQQKREVIVENCRLRSERQTLFRLPQSKAIVFSFKTYQYHLEDVKNDGYADELAAAIEGLVMGSVPEMNFYKRGVVWSEAVLQYLRS